MAYQRGRSCDIPDRSWCQGGKPSRGSTRNPRGALSLGSLSVADRPSIGSGIIDPPARLTCEGRKSFGMFAELRLDHGGESGGLEERPSPAVYHIGFLFSPRWFPNEIFKSAKINAF